MSRPSILQNKEALRKSVESSNSIREALDILGLRPAGGNYRAFREACKRHGIDVFEVQLDKDPHDDIWICEENQISHYLNGVQRMIECL
jgi:uncharacterized protein (DUF58 family)